MQNQIKYVSILGERCSGTTFVQHAITQNFGLEYNMMYRKHFFGHDDTEFRQEKMAETLVIYVVRDLVDWIDSFFKRHHHVPPHNFKTIFNFLNNEFYSIYEFAAKIGEEITEDRHIITKERYRNIFEMRKVKHQYVMDTVSQLVPHFIVVRYEDLRDNYTATLDHISERFCLNRKASNPYAPIIKYKGTYTAVYAKKLILLSERDQCYILSYASS